LALTTTARAQELSQDSSTGTQQLGGSAIAGQEPQSNKSLYRRRVHPARSALELQAGGGYQQAVGSIGGDGPTHIQDLAGVGAGGEIGVGYRISPWWLLGAYGAGAWYSGVGDVHGLHSFAVGAQAQLHLAPRRAVDPWFAMGVGYRVFASTAAGQSTSVHQAVQLPRVGLGVDYRVSHVFAIGPFVSADLSLFMGEPRPGQPGATHTTVGSFVSAGISSRFDLFGDDRSQRTERAVH
jgi:hypothetical protein